MDPRIAARRALDQQALPELRGFSSRPRPASLLVGVLMMVILAWPITQIIHKSSVHVLPSGAGNGADVAMFIGAARVIQQGGNPYDPVLLYRTESKLLHTQGVRMTPRRRIVRVGNPPLFFWLLQPLLRFPFQLAALGWMTTMLLLEILGFLAVLRVFGRQASWLASLLFVTMPQTFSTIYHANNVPILFAAVGLALMLTQRFPLAAGALLSFAWLKPQVGLPLVLLVPLVSPQGRWRVLCGFAAATALLTALTCLVLGPQSMEQWAGGLRGYGGDIAVQTAIPSLAGSYASWAPSPLQLVACTLSTLLAVVLTVYQWRLPDTGSSYVRSWALLWFVWFLVTPYTHVTDEILLAIPTVALLRTSAASLAEWLPAMGLGCLFLAALSSPYSRVGFLLPILLLAPVRQQPARSWGVLAVWSLLVMFCLSQEVSIPGNGQFLAIAAAALCFAFMAQDAAQQSQPGNRRFGDAGHYA